MYQIFIFPFGFKFLINQVLLMSNLKIIGQSVVHNATSGSKKFFLGTDSAPHIKETKVIYLLFFFKYLH